MDLGIALKPLNYENRKTGNGKNKRAMNMVNIRKQKYTTNL